MNPAIIDTDTGRTLWRSKECADHCTIKTSTWSSYVATGRAPSIVAHLDERTPLWDADEVKTWHTSRRGQGWRAGTP